MSRETLLIVVTVLLRLAIPITLMVYLAFAWSALEWGVLPPRVAEVVLGLLLVLSGLFLLRQWLARPSK